MGSSLRQQQQPWWPPCPPSHPTHLQHHRVAWVIHPYGRDEAGVFGNPGRDVLGEASLLHLLLDGVSW